MALYILDGYNLLFSAQESKGSFTSSRSDFIDFLQNVFSKVDWEGLLVFDGSYRIDEGSGRAYKSPLEIVYSYKGQTADAYIIESIEIAANPKEITVVTNDRGLTRAVRSFHGHVITNQSFLKRLEKKMHKPTMEKKTKESPKQMERLLKEFERRLNQDFE